MIICNWLTVIISSAWAWSLRNYFSLFHLRPIEFLQIQWSWTMLDIKSSIIKFSALDTYTVGHLYLLIRSQASIHPDKFGLFHKTVAEYCSSNLARTNWSPTDAFDACSKNNGTLLVATSVNEMYMAEYRWRRQAKGCLNPCAVWLIDTDILF